MQITYCDLCSTPLKENNYFMLYISTPRNNNFNQSEDYYNYIKKIEKEVKEICPTCKHVFDRMFELRLCRLSELADEINITFEMPSKKNPKERDNGKEKK